MCVLMGNKKSKLVCQPKGYKEDNQLKRLHGIKGMNKEKEECEKRRTGDKHSWEMIV